MRAGTRQVAAAEGDENRHVVVARHVAVELNLAAGALSCGSGACAVARKRGTVGCERAACVASGHRSASFGYGACPGNPTFYSIFGTERAVPSGWVPSGPYEKIVWIHRIARLRKRDEAECGIIRWGKWPRSGHSVGVRRLKVRRNIFKITAYSEENGGYHMQRF